MNSKYLHYFLAMLMVAVFSGGILSSGLIAAEKSSAGSPVKAYRDRRNEADIAKPAALVKLAGWAWEKYGEKSKKGDNPDLMKKVKSDLEKALALLQAMKEDERGTLVIEATLLLRQVKGKIKGDDIPIPKPDPGVGGDGMLDDRDILWIRLIELDKNDKVMINFEKDALDKYIESMNGKNVSKWNVEGKEAAFRKQSRLTQALEMLENKEQDVGLLQNVKVKTDSQTFKTFYQSIWPVVQQKCASARCHGGQVTQGGLRFVTDAKVNTMKGRYTNFAILSGFKDSKGRRLLSRKETAMSLLLQYGLETSELNHSKLKKGLTVKPHLFRSKNSPQFKLFSDWIGSLRRPLHPNYHIEKQELYGTKVELQGKNTDVVIPGLGT